MRHLALAAVFAIAACSYAPHKGRSSWAEVLELASASVGDDPYRREFLELVKQAQAL